MVFHDKICDTNLANLISHSHEVKKTIVMLTLLSYMFKEYLTLADNLSINDKKGFKSNKCTFFNNSIQKR